MGHVWPGRPARTAPPALRVPPGGASARCCTLAMCRGRGYRCARAVVVSAPCRRAWDGCP
eukprot:15432881-Alexandrium_andersonii.AAC.1